MICGDGDFRVNLRKRRQVDPRWEFRMFESIDGEKYRGILHAESKRIVNHRRAMLSVCLGRPPPSNRLDFTPIETLVFLHFRSSSFLLSLARLVVLPITLSPKCLHPITILFTFVA